MTPRLLFVDDEESIRITLPAVLRLEGFDVSVAATVPEALNLINSQRFDILLADLNIGQPGDGFTVVSAMRRTQPKVLTFILTGYPDFQSALEAIRQQVDDYFTKPTDIPKLVETLRSRMANPRHFRQSPSKRVATVLAENAERILRDWLVLAKANKELPGHLEDQERIDHLPALLQNLRSALESNRTDLGKVDARPWKQLQSMEGIGPGRVTAFPCWWLRQEFYMLWFQRCCLILCWRSNSARS